MLEQTLRHHYQYWLVDPIVKIIPNPIQPIHITLLSGIIGLLIIPAMLFQSTLTALLCLLLSGYLDTVDGSIARYRNTTSISGTVADIMMDRIVEFATIFALFVSNPQAHALICILMLGAMLLCITSFLVVAIFTPNQSAKGFHYSPGIIERAEAIIFFSFMIILPQYFWLIGMTFVALTTLTTAIRLCEFYRNNAST